MVAPFTGAWIEISNLRNISSGCWKSHPSRVRGLKLCQRNDVFDNRGVAPFTGAWIEIKRQAFRLQRLSGRTLHGCVD